MKAGKEIIPDKGYVLKYYMIRKDKKAKQAVGI
jgi:hypothetical protein